MAGKTGKNGKTRAFTSVNYSAARLAREKQRREYEQQKKEKLIFALFVVIILVMILFAILIFKKVLGDDPATTDTETADTGVETTVDPPIASAYESEAIAKNAIYAGNLILIDSSKPYRAADKPELVDIYTSRTKFDKADSKNGYVYSYYSVDRDELLEKETLAALNAMADAFYEATGNYDLYTHTNATYVEGADDEHATGRAVNLSVYTAAGVHYEIDDPAASDDFEWVEQNYYKYGFIRRYPESKAAITGVSDEPYHFLYVGTAHAYYMYKNDLCLEEYLELLRTEHAFADEGKDNLVFTAGDGSRYEVYYVAADGDVTNVPVPADSNAHSISGDNMNGFVVTVKLG